MLTANKDNTGISVVGPVIGDNAIRYSRLYEYASARVWKPSIGIKYVLQGTEGYQTTSQYYNLKQGQYLLINPGESFSAHFKTQSIAVGVCIDIDASIYRHVLSTQQKDAAYLLDNPANSFGSNATVIDGVFDINENGLGKVIDQISRRVADNTESYNDTTEELYYELAAVVAASQTNVRKSIAAIPAKKYAVQKELYRRLSFCRNYMNDVFAAHMSTEELARIAMMSPYHFIRSFRQVYGITPHQYLLQLRLKHAKELLQSTATPVTEIATVCGFADLFCFSKAFKKKYGIAPTYLQKQQ